MSRRDRTALLVRLADVLERERINRAAARNAESANAFIRRVVLDAVDVNEAAELETASHFVRKCAICGCREDRACVVEGVPCCWVGPELCSGCATLPAILRSSSGRRFLRLLAETSGGA